MLEFLDRRDRKPEIEFLNDKKKSEDEVLSYSLQFLMYLKNNPHVENRFKNDLDKKDKSDKDIIETIEKKFPEMGYIGTRIIASNIKFALTIELDKYEEVRQAFLKGDKEATKVIDEKISEDFFESISNTEAGEDKYFRRRNLADQNIKDIRNNISGRFRNVYRTLINKDLMPEYRRKFHEPGIGRTPKSIEELIEITGELEKYHEIKSLYTNTDYEEVKKSEEGIR